MENGSVQSITIAVQSETAVYKTSGMTIPVKILDCRKIWGRVDCLITPVGGAGQQWVEKRKLQLDRRV